MNVDRILEAFNSGHVEYLLIGGMNYMLRHEPQLTYDVDIWINDAKENRARCEAALKEIEAEWGADEHEWGPVAQLPQGWLGRQAMFCLTSPHGAVDVFRAVSGLDSWDACNARAVAGATTGGIRFRGLSDEDMLRCQEALPASVRKEERIRVLRSKLKKSG